MVSHPEYAWIAAACLTLVVAASVTDLKWRRIPNYLTLPGILAGFAIHFVGSGWWGLLLAFSGTLLAPCVLSLLHGGKGLGMGDIKLAAALGALFGPVMGTVAMLASGVCGGILAVFWIFKELGFFRNPLAAPAEPEGAGLHATGESTADTPIGQLKIPFGLALSMGAVITLGLGWLTGAGKWFL